MKKAANQKKSDGFGISLVSETEVEKNARCTPLPDLLPYKEHLSYV